MLVFLFLSIVSVSEAFDRITLRYKHTSRKEANESVVKK